MSPIRELLDRFGWFGCVRVLFYPITTTLTTPVRLIQTLWACRVLLSGQNWTDYNHFNAVRGLSHMFYWIRAHNFHAFGRSGWAPYMGHSGYRLSSAFNFSLLSLYAYWKAGAVTLLVGMFCWWMAHVIWAPTADPVFLATVMTLTLISSSFYANTFSNENYAVLGWMFFPLGLYGLMTGCHAYAGVAWLLAGFGCFTVACIGIAMSCVMALVIGEWTPALFAIPAIIKVALQFWPSIANGTIWPTLIATAKLIGVIRHKVRWQRRSSMFGLLEFYLIGLLGQYVFARFYISGELPIVLVTTVVILVGNSFVSRFADIVTMQLLVVSVAIADSLLLGDWYILPSLLLILSPLPGLTLTPLFPGVLDIVPVMKPFSPKRILAGIIDFVSPVAPGSRVLMAFNNPDGEYLNLFDHHRALVAPIQYVACLGDFTLVPDWVAVVELNYENAPEIWGRDLLSVSQNMKQWAADYVIVYTVNDEPLGKEWTAHRFTEISTFDWKDFEKDRRGHTFMREGPPPKWHLLRPPAEPLPISVETIATPGSEP